MMIVRMICQAPDCDAQCHYPPTAVKVSLYTHGVCSLSFVCKTCGETSEVTIPDRLAIALDAQGCPTTIVHTPDEVLEWPRIEVPAIDSFDVAVFERSSHAHFEECVRRELGDILGDNARSDG